MQNKWLALVPVLLCTGCGPDFMSIHPLYRDDDLVSVLPLTGSWTRSDGESTDVWKFKSVSDDKTCVLSFDDQEESLECNLVQLSNFLFLDISNRYAGATGIRGHQFFQVEIDVDTLRLASVDEDWLRQQLETNNALDHERVRTGKEEKFVIRAATRDLQAFLLNHARDPRAFEEWLTFTRTKE